VLQPNAVIFPHIGRWLRRVLLPGNSGLTLEACANQPFDRRGAPKVPFPFGLDRRDLAPDRVGIQPADRCRYPTESRFAAPSQKGKAFEFDFACRTRRSCQAGAECCFSHSFQSYSIPASYWIQPEEWGIFSPVSDLRCLLEFAAAAPSRISASYGKGSDLGAASKAVCLASDWLWHRVPVHRLNPTRHLGLFIWRDP